MIAALCDKRKGRPAVGGASQGQAVKGLLLRLRGAAADGTTAKTVGAGILRHEVVQVRRRRHAAGGCDHAARTVERAGGEFAAEQAPSTAACDGFFDVPVAM